MSKIQTDGYVQEIFSSFQGEGAAVSGSCYGLRQIFIRFAGCPLALGKCGTKGCIWCDSPKAQRTNPKFGLFENEAGSQQFKKIENPISIETLVNEVEKLSTPDLHSISLTGGEPLLQKEYLSLLIDELKKRNYKIYLETAYTDDLAFLKELASKIDYACVDIKDRSAQAASNWSNLVEQEVQMCKILKKGGCKTFAKIVISDRSDEKDFHFIAGLCGKYQIPLVIQPVTTRKNVKIDAPKWEKIRHFAEIAGKYLSPENIGLSVQVHKLINIL